MSLYVTDVSVCVCDVPGCIAYSRGVVRHKRVSRREAHIKRDVIPFLSGVELRRTETALRVAKTALEVY